MKRLRREVQVCAWFEQDSWVVHVMEPKTDASIAFGNCVSRKNVGRTAVSVAAKALKVEASQIKLVKVDYIDNQRF